MAKVYNLFLSHSWAYGDAYDKLKSLLQARGHFPWKDFSVPKNDPVHARSDRELRAAIDNKIRLCNAVVVMAGVYSTYSKWINIEIEIAKAYNKPIIAVKPWAQTRISSVVSKAATVIVGWNKESVVKAIRDYGV